MSAEPLNLDGRSWRFLQSPDAYTDASADADRPLAREPTRRQFRTAEAILCRLAGVGAAQVGGVLLADDVGLGKTTVAALVAWVVAGTGGTVRVFAPNDVLRRRWEEELKAHVPLLQRRAPALEVSASQIKSSQTERLRAGRIQVGTHHDLVIADKKGQLRAGCSLLIVDEAHRAKGEESAFRQALVEQGRWAASKLILTATPFSIAVDELAQLLRFCDAKGVEGPVRRYARALQRLYAARAGRDPAHEGRKLVAAAREAMDALAPYLIRHGVDDLSVAERRHFGEVGAPWRILVPPADERALEMLLRTDRLLRLTREFGRERTNDARFHVGWQHLAQELGRVQEDAPDELPAPQKGHLARAQYLQRVCTRGAHPKAQAVAEAVAERVEGQEKVLVFCHHRATALELLGVLDAKLRLKAGFSDPLSAGVWRKEWKGLLLERAEKRPWADAHSDAEALLETFLDWLCSPGLRRQVLAWLPQRPRTGAELASLLSTSRVRGRAEAGVPYVADAADDLYRNLTDERSRSTLGLLRKGVAGELALPGTLEGGRRVLGAWEHGGNAGALDDVLWQRTPDVVLSLFNSPFGPDVLVTTDRLSEGVDLHRSCRLLVHYELDPSPIRTLQRNGRVRRVGGWAALTGKPVEYAYPSFGGTRDGSAVRVMGMRLRRFDLLLGGVPPVGAEEDEEAKDEFTRRVLEACGDALRTENRKLRL